MFKVKIICLSKLVAEKSRLLIFMIEPFVARMTDQRTNYLQNRCSYMRGMCTETIKPLSQLGAEKIAFHPKPDIRINRQTDIRT